VNRKKPREEARVWDAARSRDRMRAHRAKTGGMSPVDRARKEATKRLIERHRAEFDGTVRKLMTIRIEHDHIAGAV